MDRSYIKERMQEAGLKTPARGDFIFIHWDQIAMLIEYERKEEREACAKVCDEYAELFLENDQAKDCADAIRARGNT